MKFIEVKLITCLLIFVAGMISCSDDDSKVKTTSGWKPIDFTRAELDAYHSGRSFEVALFKKYVELSGNENIILSPLSAMLDLGMIANGASGETLDEVLEAMGLEKTSLEDFNSFSNRLTTNLHKVDKSTEISLGNAVFYEKSFLISPSFIGRIKEYYLADVFAVEDGEVQKSVYSWLSKYIPNLKLDKTENDRGSVCSFLNAFRFKGAWSEAFDKGNSAEYDFFGLDNEVSKVEYLCSKRVVGISQNEYFVCVHLDFGNGAYSLCVYLPNEAMGIDACLEQFDVQMYNDLSTDWERFNINLRIPKFDLTHDAALIPSMKGLGINRIFSSGEAQFGNLSESSLGLFVGRLKQCSGFSIDEEGAVMETYTQGDMWITSPAPVEIKDGDDLFFDHPFVFAIRENSSGAILFMGKIGKL